MNPFKNSVYLLALLVFMSSCGIMGIHIHLHNPHKAGKYPKFDKETILLGELTPIRRNFDVVFYDLDVQIFPDTKKIGGWVEIKSVALKDLDSVQLDLDQPLTILELRANSRTGESLNYTRKYRGVFIKLSKTVKQGEVFSVYVKYIGKPIVAKKPPWRGGMVWKKDKQKNLWIGVVCESEGSSIWFPCKDHTSDEPDSVHARFSIADTSLTIVSNGTLTNVENTGKLKSFSWRTQNPINTYNITFYAGNFECVKDTYYGIFGKQLLLNHYVLKPHAQQAATHFKQVKKHIRVYEELYGEYQWYTDGFKLVESPYQGEEHQSAIAYGNGFKNDLYGREDYIMLHETGHEWFGNAVSAADLCDVWLQEGITTYGEVLYLEKTYSSQLALNHLLMYRLVIKNKFPVVGPQGRRYFDYKDGDVYTKGAWILQTLRNNLNNDSVFFQIFKTFYNENKLKLTDSKQFIATVNRVTGKDYTWFFNQYLYKNKVPVFEYEYAADGSLYYRWLNTDETFNKLAVKVGFDDFDKNEFKHTTLYPGKNIQKYVPQKNEKVATTFNINGTQGLFAVVKSKKLHKKFLKENAATH